MNNPSEQSVALLLLVLAQLPGIGPTRANAILSRFGVDGSVCDADPQSLMLVSGIGETLARETAGRLSNQGWMKQARQNAEDQLDRAGRIHTSLVTILDPTYPSLLKEIYDPPPLLFVRGNIQALCHPSLAVVGTRKATSYGKQATAFFCRDLAACGYSIFSGLAYGIDMAAHRATIDSGGTTVAVLGCGVDIIYTDPTGRLWPEIIEHGAIVSEEWIGSQPAPGNFPKRNRLISGLTSGTLIVESDIKGGSMITASCALEQNREVFAVPGSIFARASRGPNHLIQQSQAKPVLSAEDILSELPVTGHLAQKKLAITSPSATPLTPDERSIMEALEDDALHIDVIAIKTGLTLEHLLVHLFELEMKHLIAQEAGQLFRKRFPDER